MSHVLLQLGRFQFEADAVSYQSLRRSQSVRWISVNRLSRRPAQQFIGLGDSCVEIRGHFYPITQADRSAFSNIQTLAHSREPHVLVDGLGNVLGAWVLKDLVETDTYFHANGLPRKQSFRLKLQYYGEDT